MKKYILPFLVLLLTVSCKKELNTSVIAENETESAIAGRVVSISFTGRCPHRPEY